MLRLLKLMILLLFMGFVGLTGYAYLGDMAPERRDISEPVELNVGD
ncbi:MAG: hypothetical protein KDE08_04070 [Rhodobacteraceae bacterium]|nr:hypothetical protein [Paracoccaceae bacterium]